MADLHVEYARARHFDGIRALELGAFTEVIRPERLHATPTRMRDMGVRLVAVEGERVVGYLSGVWLFEPLERAHRSIYVLLLAVGHHRHDTGIRRRLLTTLFERAGARGGRAFHACVDERDQAARELYQALGFEIARRHDGLYASGAAGLAMVRRLSLDEHGTLDATQA